MSVAVAAGKAQPEAAAVDIGLVVIGRAEALRLDGRIGRDPAEHPSKAIAAFEASADALRIELRGEVIPSEGEPVRGHPVVGEGEGRREIGRAGAGGAIHAGLEGIALAATQPLRQAPIGAAAGEGKAHHRIGGQAIVEAAGHATVRADTSWLPMTARSPLVRLLPP